MTFFKDLDTIMKQDFGNRGLLKALPDNPIRETLETLSTARRVILLTGFPVRLEDGTYVGEKENAYFVSGQQKKPLIPLLEDSWKCQWKKGNSGGIISSKVTFYG